MSFFGIYEVICIYIYKDIIDPYFLAWFQFCVWRTTSWTFPVREVCLAAPSAWASQWRWQRSWCFSSCTKQPKVLRKGRQHGGFCIFAIHQLPNISPPQKKTEGTKSWNSVSYLKFYGVTVRDVGIGKSSWLQGGPETLRCAYHFLAAEWREGRLDVEALRRNGVWILNRHLAQQRFGGGDHHMDKTSRAKIDLHHLPSFIWSVSMRTPGRRQPKTFDKGLNMPKHTELVCTNTSGEGNLGLEQATFGWCLGSESQGNFL